MALGVLSLASLQFSVEQSKARSDSVSRRIAATKNNQKLTDRVINYFRSKFVSRSVIPIEGTSTDAILSRIEDFLKKGQ